jgi:hypothetical protein
MIPELNGLAPISGTTVSVAAGYLSATSTPPAGARGVIISPASNTTVNVSFNPEKGAPSNAVGHPLIAGSILKHYGSTGELGNIHLSGTCQITYLGK